MGLESGSSEVRSLLNHHRPAMAIAEGELMTSSRPSGKLRDLDRETPGVFRLLTPPESKIGLKTLELHRHSGHNMGNCEQLSRLPTEAEN
jgi:hypothetical protein